MLFKLWHSQCYYAGFWIVVSRYGYINRHRDKIYSKNFATLIRSHLYKTTEGQTNSKPVFIDVDYCISATLSSHILWIWSFKSRCVNNDTSLNDHSKTKLKKLPFYNTLFVSFSKKNIYDSNVMQITHYLLILFLFNFYHCIYCIYFSCSTRINNEQRMRLYI